MTAFDKLKPEYTKLLSRMVLTRASEIDYVVAKRHDAHGRPTSLLAYVEAGKYRAGCAATGVPEAWAAASFEREAASNFALNPAQGWPLHSRSRVIPHNGPFHNWTDAQIAAYAIDGLDRVGADNWTWERACFEAEAFNGFGYRAYGVHSPYLWAGTNIYTAGKYIRDGHFSRTTVDQQLGVIPMMVGMIERSSDLGATTLGFPFPSHHHAAPIPPPQRPPIGTHGASWVQAALNLLFTVPRLIVDNSYGRETRRAVTAFQHKHRMVPDGFAGPKTRAMIEAKLQELGSFF
jgi:lysozyme family protein